MKISTFDVRDDVEGVVHEWLSGYTSAGDGQGEQYKVAVVDTHVDGLTLRYTGLDSREEKYFRVYFNVAEYTTWDGS